MEYADLWLHYSPARAPRNRSPSVAWPQRQHRWVDVSYVALRRLPPGAAQSMRTRAVLLAIGALLASQLASLGNAQSPGSTPPLVGTWLLSGLERATPGQPLTRVMNPVGMLIQSANGY